MPLPLEQTIKQLDEDIGFSDLPSNYIMTHQIKGDELLLRNLVDINKVYRALVWLKNNNEFYKDIDLPSRPELLFTSLPDHQIPSYSNNLEASHDKNPNPEQIHHSFDKTNVCPVHTKEASNQSASSSSMLITKYI